MLKWIYALACLVIVFNSSAQRFAGTPPTVKWKQINTDSARIIFPAGLDSQAQRVASLVHYQAAQNLAALGNQVRKINIVLQNQTAIANGYVGLGPYRSEFYMTPDVNNFDQGSVAWGDGLAIHEYRHVQQFNNFRNGISKLMGTLFGEEGYALAINASVPDWFYEGDAVYHETILSSQGRGRLPLFMNAYPSLWKENKKYSWMKLRNGSLKDYVPDHYNLGYLLVNYGYEKYGLDFWSKVTGDASAFKGLFYPFQKAVQKYAGVTFQSFRNNALEYYKDLTQTLFKGEGLQESFMRNITAVNKNYVTDAVFPYQVSADSLLYLKTSFRHRPAFYIKDAAGEHRLRVRDISIDEQFSYRNGKIVYAAYEKDARWSWRDYSVIKLLDIHTGRQQTITRRSKYFSPDISAGGNKIAAVQIAINGKSELHILDAVTGEVKNKISSAEVNLFTDPKFIGEDSVVSAVRLLDGKMALAIINLITGSSIRLTPPSFNVVGFPCVSNNIVYFTASYGGNDNVYAIKLGDEKIYKITNSVLGNYFVNAGNGKITWSAFTAEGYQFQQQDEASVVWEPVSMNVAEELKAAYPVSNTNKISEILLGNTPNRYFPISNYKKDTKLLNFHSWRPYYEDPEFTFSLYGQNVLNTMETELYYLYNKDEKINAAGVSAIYGKWFPYLSIGTQMTFARQQIVDSSVRQWNQLDSRIGINVPLSFVHGRMNDFLNIGTNYFLRNQFNTGPNKNLTGKNDFTYLHHFFSWTQQVATARQHIFPRLGYALNVNHRHAVTRVNAYQLLGSASVYLPGVASTHSLVLTGAFQQRDTSRAVFSSGFANARGHSDYYPTNAGSRMWRASANYHFPLLYPDWGFANILYLKRIRGNVFYDFQRLYSNSKKQTLDLRSAGAEFYVDTKWWNQYELSFGFRVSRLLDNDLFTGSKTTVFEFILPVSIFPK
ncbi:MAG: hypothetical protein ABI675_00210 [Chitinophagaceae bacterium]